MLDGPNLFEVFEDAIESRVGAAVVRREAVDAGDVQSVAGGDRARLGELPVVTVDHLAARLVARQVLQQVRPVPFLQASKFIEGTDALAPE